MAREYRIFLGLLLLWLLSVWLSSQKAYMIFLTFYLLYSLYRGSVFFQKHFESRKRVFIKTIRKRSSRRVNAFIGLVFLALGFLEYFDVLPETVFFSGELESVMPLILILTGLYPLLAIFVKKCPTTEVIIRPDHVEIVQSGTSYLLTYSIRDFSISTNTLKIDYAKNSTFELDKLDISPEQIKIIKEELTQLIETVKNEVTKRKKGWQALNTRLKRVTIHK